MKKALPAIVAITGLFLSNGTIAFAQNAIPAPTTGTQPAPVASTAPTPGDASANAGAAEAYNALNKFDINVAAPAPPLMGTITQEVAFTIDKKEIQRGDFTGVIVHLHNGTNSPIMFDGDRAKITLGGNVIAAVTDAKLEQEVAPNPSVALEASIAVRNAVTVGAYSAISDQLVGQGPILPRYGSDQMRREATLERFGLRILWPGDDTQGIVFFPAGQKLAGGKVELPVVTFPTREIRGYLSGTR